MAAAPAMDARSRIPARLSHLGMKHASFCELVGVHKVEFSRMLNGTRPLTAAQSLKFDETLRDLEDAANLLTPLKLDFNNVPAIRALLDCDMLDIPNLFKVLIDAAKSTPERTQLTAIHADAVECARLDAQMAEMDRSHEEWLRFFHETNPSALLDMP